jgi:hypothetical protein
LILKIEGEEKLAKLNQDLASEELALKNLVLLKNQGAGGLNPAAIEASAAKVIQLTKEVNQAKFSLASFQGSALQLQYVMDDLVNTSGDWTRHLASISNNIPGLVTSLGLSGGVAGAVGIISTALIALTPIAKAAWDALAGNAPEVAKEKIKEIETHIKAVQAAFDKLANKPTNYEQEQAAEVKAIFGERPMAEDTKRSLAREFTPDEVLKGLNEKETNELGTINKDILSDKEIEIRGGKEGGFFGRNSIVRNKLLEARQQATMRRDELERTARDRMAMELITQAGTEGPAGNAALGRLTRIVEANPDNFRRGLGHSLVTASAAAMRKWDDEQADFNAGNEEWAEKAHAARAERAKVARENAELTRQGEHYRDQQLRQQEQESQRETREAEQYLRRAPAREREARQSQAEQGIRRMAGQQGMSPNDEQVKGAAADALRLVAEGADTNDAMMASFRGMVQQSRALQQRMAQQKQQWMMEQNRLQMGPDYSGQYSQMSPWMPGGY